MSRLRFFLAPLLVSTLFSSLGHCQSLWESFQARAQARLADQTPAEREAFRTLAKSGALATLLETWESQKATVLEDRFYQGELSQEVGETEHTNYMWSRRKVEAALASDPSAKPGQRLRYLAYSEPILSQGHVRAPKVRVHLFSRGRGAAKSLEFVAVDLATEATVRDHD